MQRSGILLMVSGPSGSGKTTLCRRLANEGHAIYAVSATTRPPRPGEVNGRDYHFLSHEEFTQQIAQDAFLEHAEVHGNHYGTLKSEVIRHLIQGTDVVMDIDVQGAATIRQCPDAQIQLALSELFVMPANDEELKARLTGRGTDSDEVIALRLKNARDEQAHWPDYQHLLLSTDRESDYTQFLSLLRAERLKTKRLIPQNTHPA